jgi:hypothetical protein
MIVLSILLFLTIIATGITYVAHLQRRLLDAQEALVSHFIELVRAEINEKVPQSNNEIREFIALCK